MIRQVLFLDSTEKPSEVVRTALRAEDVAFTVMHDVDAALEELSENPPSVVFVDLSMPRLVGFLRGLRGSAHEVPVLIMCTPCQVEQAVATLSYGVTDYLLKPLHLDEVLAKLSRILGSPEAKGAVSESSSQFPELTDERLFKAVQRFEFDYVRRAVARFHGDKRVAAKHLGISLSSLYRKLDHEASVG